MPEQYQSALTGPQMDQALLDMANHTSERYAKGTANGAAVPSGTVGYQDNAKYYRDLAANQAQTATNAAGTASNAATQASSSEATASNAASMATSAATTATQQATRAQNAADRAEAIVGGQFVSYGQAQGLTDAQKARARSNIGAGTGAGGINANQLDNPWWTVNQKEATSGTFVVAKGAIDRWNTAFATNSGGSWSLSNGILTLTGPNNSTGQWQQVFTDPGRFNGRTLTASAMLSDGTVYSGTITRTNGTTQTFFESSQTGGVFGLSLTADNVFRIGILAGKTVALKAVKLEYGDSSTLLNDGPPEYQSELDKCRLYYKRLKVVTTSGLQMGLAVCTTTTNASLYAFIGRMVALPTLKRTGSFDLRLGNTIITVQDIAVSAVSLYTEGCINLNFTASGLTVNALARIVFGSGAMIELSAEP